VKTLDELTVVFVCTGNRFRSPLAELIFRRAAGDVPVRTASRGTLELGPLPALPEALEEAERLGLDLASHRARPIDGEDLSSMDLVLGFERMHVVAAVVEASAPRERTFTLPELVELLEAGERPSASEPVERAREAISAAATARRDRHAVPEVLDPIGQPRQVFRETAAELEDLVGRLTDRLFAR
jgi:protein-tyrosine-phosphatase